MTDEQYPYQDELNARRLRCEADDRESDITRDKLLSKLHGIVKGREVQDFDPDISQVAFDTVDSLAEQRDNLEQQLANQRKALEALWNRLCGWNKHIHDFDEDLYCRTEEIFKDSDSLDDFITKILAAE